MHVGAPHDTLVPGYSHAPDALQLDVPHGPVAHAALQQRPPQTPLRQDAPDEQVSPAARRQWPAPSHVPAHPATVLPAVGY